MLEKTIDLDVPDTGHKQRLDRWLTETIPDLSRAKIQKLITRGKILVNGQTVKANRQLRSGEQIHIEVEAEAPSLLLKPHPMKLDILFEDDELLVLNKAAGISVHPGAGEREPTLVEGVLHWLGRKSEELENSIRPGIVHRLDKDTTGLMVYAKNERTQSDLSKQFASKKLPREYLALLDGFLAHSQIEHETYLFRDPQHRKRFASIREDAYIKRFGHPVKAGTGYRLANTLFLRQESYQSRITLASIFLRTGRTHQIRVHSKDLQCPVLGDPLYNSNHEFPKSIPLTLRKKMASLKRQMLHARTLAFIHPRSGEEMRFEAPVPTDFQELLELLRPLKD